jgi:hypothetical protein
MQSGLVIGGLFYSQYEYIHNGHPVTSDFPFSPFSISLGMMSRPHRKQIPFPGMKNG